MTLKLSTIANNVVFGGLVSMADTWDDFRRFEEMMNRMFEDFWGRPRRPLLPSGEKGEIVPAEYRQPFIDVIETDKEVDSNCGNARA